MAATTENTEIDQKIQFLLQKDIPEHRKSLQDSHVNLENVARYCMSNYNQNADKFTALETTKNYTTQSLASVAYQINNLASSFLELLDLQSEKLSTMESSVNHLNQTVMIHKEKVARKEIGLLTTNKTTSRPPGVRQPGIIFPEQSEKTPKYQRQPIKFDVFDGIGHSYKPAHQNKPKRSNSSAGQPGTPPLNRISHGSMQNPYGTVGRMDREKYRHMVPAVNAPTVPPIHAANFQGSRMSDLNNRGSYQGESDIPPPPPISTHPMHDVDPSLPPPPPESIYGSVQPALRNRLSSEEMPPPPYDQSLAPPPMFAQPDAVYDAFTNVQRQAGTGLMRQPGQYQSSEEQSWIPQNYIEKVVAIYDYESSKEDELTFTEGAIIYVLKKNEDDWWEGVMNGVTGLFPSNYVESCM